MKVRELKRHLDKYDEEKEIFFFEIMDVYDTVLLAIDDDEDHVIFNIKNYKKEENEGALH